SRFVITACEGQGWVSKINLQLETGKIRANVNKAPKVTREEFKLKTPTSILAVRGTEFFVSWEQGSGGQVRENIGVSEGLVEVKSLFDSMSPGTMVGTGTEFQAMGKVSEVAGQIKVEAAGAPKVDQFTADEQRQFEQNTKADNQAFEKAVEIPTGKSSDSEAKNENKKTDNFLAAATKESGRGLSSESDSSEEGRGPRFKKAIGRVNAQAPGGAGVLSGLDAPGSGQINQPGFPNIVSATFVWGVKAP
ncbi:MAG: hypothetical protein EBZ49_18715, partial [Proteobacteria bacterium]|nr:hypothetical protein [Pseudomonadota bacterium]